MLLEHLEDRRLLATAAEPFTGPSLSGLISQAFHGKDTAQATIKTMLSALQTQLTDGPLTALSSGAVKGNVFVSEAQSLVASYNQNVDQQLLPHFTHIDNMLKLQGQQVVANLVSLYQQSTVGTPTTLILSGYLPLQAGAAINTLTKGPIYSLNTPVSGYVTATQTFETNLGVVANTLSSTATPTLTLPQVSTTIQGEAEAYRASMDAGLQVTHSNLSSTVNAAVTTLEDTVITIANANSSTAQADIHSAIAAFDSTILDTTGLFGLNGPVILVNSELGYVPHNLTGKQAATTIDNVSGTATFGEPATLMATLINSATGTGLIGKVVSFTLDGGFAGIAVTNSSGVATLTGVPQSDNTGTDTGGIVASFSGDSTNLLSQNSGNLVVTQAPAITSANSTTFTVGTAGSFTVTATGTPTPTLSETGALPSGVTFDAATGVLSGTPAAGTGGTYPLTFTAANGVPPNATQTFTLTVDQAPAITSANSTTFTVGTAGSFTMTTTGFPTPTPLTETGTLPTGVTFVDNKNGTATLGGTPAAGTGGTYPLTFTASNGVGSAATQTFTLTVNQVPAITSATSQSFAIGIANTFTVTATGFPTPTLSESSTDMLPSGVTFDAATGVLSGTPAATAGGTYTLHFTASNSVGSAPPQTFTLTVAAAQAPTITSATSTTFTTGTAGSFPVTTTGIPTAALSETGALPSGVTFVDNGDGTATLAGTPAASTGGTYTLMITAANGVTPNATQSFTLTVRPGAGDHQRGLPVVRHRQRQHVHGDGHRLPDPDAERDRRLAQRRDVRSGHRRAQRHPGGGDGRHVPPDLHRLQRRG